MKPISTLWYISKYTAPPYAAKVSSRGFYILREWVAMGKDCTMITSTSNHLANSPSFSGNHLTEILEGVKVCWLKVPNYHHPHSFKRILGWVLFELSVCVHSRYMFPKPDVVIFSSLSLLSVISGLYLRLVYRAKLVFEVRDVWPLVVIENAKYSKYNPLVIILGIIEKIGYMTSDLIVGLMPNLEQHVRIVAPLSKAPVVCIPHGIEDGSIRFKLAPLSVLEAIPNDKFIICHAGSIGFDNALDTFLDCASLMSDSSHQILFMLIGDGPLKLEYIRKYGGLSNLLFLDSVAKECLQSIFRKVDVLYFATHDSIVLNYGQSLNKLIDYMLSGKPIIGSFSGYQSMINESGCGDVVPAGDLLKLRDLILDYSSQPSQNLLRKGNAGKEWVNNNRSFSVLSRKYMDFINEIPSHSVKT